jgi:hypothetical protein
LVITDKPPRDPTEKDEYQRSDAMVSFALPPEEPLRQYALQLEEAMKTEDKRLIQKVCNAVGATVAASYNVKPPTVRILGVRPLEEAGGRVDETFGDYDFASARIRLWMRTAVLEKVTSFGTLSHTLCHELCHHLDVVSLDLPNTYHTRGFYERAALLYHHLRGTPRRPLVWDKNANGTYRINWPATMRGKR